MNHQENKNELSNRALLEKKQVRLADPEDDLFPDQLYYLISWKWFKLWKDYVTWDDEQLYSDHSEERPSLNNLISLENLDMSRPSSLDNSDLLLPIDLTKQPVSYQRLRAEPQEERIETPVSEEDAKFFQEIALQENTVLKPRLQEGVDFTIISEKVWKLFELWYVAAPPIPRKVIEDGRLVVEVYPLQLTFHYGEKGITSVISRKASLLQLQKLARHKFNLDPKLPIELYSYWACVTEKISGQDDETLDSLKLIDGQSILITSATHPLPESHQNSMASGFPLSQNSSPEFTDSSIGEPEFPDFFLDPLEKKSESALNMKSTDSVTNEFPEEREGEKDKDKEKETEKEKEKKSKKMKWWNTLKSLVSPGSAAVSSSSISNGSSSSSSGSSSPSNPSSSTSLVLEKIKLTPNSPYNKGLCGLDNLGNTCFMNSGIQCLSNTPELNQYFLSGKYKSEINKTNPIGMKGQLAEQFGNLMKQMWLGSGASVAPKHMKWIIGKFAPQFNGFQQHDAQELLAFLLDGLHEDLNRIVKKPYTEKKESDGRTDEEVAKESWDLHLQRNQSVIVDLFQGQLKSTLTCPECDKTSITFDPFMFLSLPLPTETRRTMTVILLRNEEHQVPELYSLKLQKKDSVLSLRQELSKLSNIPPENLYLADVHSSKIYSFLTDQKPLSQIRDNDVTYAYEVPPQESGLLWFILVQRIHISAETNAVTVSRPNMGGSSSTGGGTVGMGGGVINGMGGYGSRIPYRRIAFPIFFVLKKPITGELLYQTAWRRVRRFLKIFQTKDIHPNNTNNPNSPTTTNNPSPEIGSSERHINISSVGPVCPCDPLSMIVESNPNSDLNSNLTPDSVPASNSNTSPESDVQKSHKEKEEEQEKQQENQQENQQEKQQEKEQEKEQGKEQEKEPEKEGDKNEENTNPKQDQSEDEKEGQEVSEKGEENKNSGTTDSSLGQKAENNQTDNNSETSSDDENQEKSSNDDQKNSPKNENSNEGQAENKEEKEEKEKETKEKEAPSSEKPSKDGGERKNTQKQSHAPTKEELKKQRKRERKEKKERRAKKDKKGSNLNGDTDPKSKSSKDSSTSNSSNSSSSNNENLKQWQDDSFPLNDEIFKGVLPFTLKLLDTHSTSCPLCTNPHCYGHPIPFDSKPLSPSIFSKQIPVLSVDWETTIYKTLYDPNTEKLVKETTSVSQQKEETKKKALSLYDCLTLFSNKEQLDVKNQWRCPQCKDFRQAWKKLELFRLPSVLIVHLKRFQYSRYMREKLLLPVDFPLQQLDLSPYLLNAPSTPQTYNLFAVSNHIGGLGGGHYTAYAKNRVTDKWYHFNDSTCRIMDETSIKSPAAYVLFYVRADATLAPELPIPSPSPNESPRNSPNAQSEAQTQGSTRSQTQNKLSSVSSPTLSTCSSPSDSQSAKDTAKSKHVD